MCVINFRMFAHTAQDTKMLIYHSKFVKVIFGKPKAIPLMMLGIDIWLATTIPPEKCSDPTLNVLLENCVDLCIIVLI